MYYTFQIILEFDNSMEQAVEEENMRKMLTANNVQK